MAETALKGTLPKCKHGLGADDGRYVGSWNAPFDRCGCCGISFPYIDSAVWSAGKPAEVHTKGLCTGCGGKA